MKFFLLLFYFFSIAAVYGQDYCNPSQRPAGIGEGGFNIVGKSIGCVPFDVVVEKTVGENPLYIYDYKGGDPIRTSYNRDTATTFRYTKAGVYRILQLISNGTGAVMCRTLQVFNLPNFTARVCSGRKVQVTIPDDSTTKDYDEFTINWGGGVTSKVAKSASMVASYTYPTNTNTANITVTGSVAGQSLGCSKPAVALVLSNTNLSAVTISKVAVRTDGFVDVSIKGSQGATAEVQIKTVGGAFMNTGQIMTSRDTSTVTIRNVDALKNTYCFRLSANDGCDNAATTSDEVCSTNLEVMARNGQNDLTWQEYPTATGAASFQGYSFVVNGAAKGSRITNRLTTSQSDRDIVCNEQFCYQMTVTLAGGATSVSPLRCVKAISDETPSIVQNAFVSVDEQKIELRADEPSNGTTPGKFKTIFLRADNGSTNFKEIAVKDNTFTFKDESANPASQSYCYQIQYENACGNRSQPTAAVCSIYLSSKTPKTIDWTPETPFLSAINRYELEVVDEQGGVIAQENLSAIVTYDPSALNPDQQLFRYRILAYAQGPTSRISYSNYYTFTRDPLIFVPDAFSPNKDNINDIFAPLGQLVDKSRLIIYNRWGQVLYETLEASKGWNGDIGTQPAPEGTYVYRIEITDTLGQQFFKTGTVFLAR